MMAWLRFGGEPSREKASAVRPREASPEQRRSEVGRTAAVRWQSQGAKPVIQIRRARRRSPLN